jgi:hypothetical protein
MSVFMTAIPLVSGVLGLVFCSLLLRRFAARKGAHQLTWAAGLLFYAAGALCEAAFGAFGWSPWIFRIWYATGAVLSAAWLGQGTVYLLVRRPWVHVLTGLLAAASVYAVVRVFTATLDPSAVSGVLSGRALPKAVRSLTPFLNSYGTLALVGGAIFSTVWAIRKKADSSRAAGNILIAVGALLPAVGGSLSRAGLVWVLYVFELVGIVTIFLGYLRISVAPRK